MRFMLDTGEYETIATSLPQDFTISDIKELYHSRWGIETSFRELKYCIGLVNLHGKKDEFVFQEIYAALIMYNFCNRISGEVVVRQKKENVYAYKVNLTMAIYLCREFYRNAQGNGEKLMQDISKYRAYPTGAQRQPKHKSKIIRWLHLSSSGMTGKEKTGGGIFECCPLFLSSYIFF